MMLQQTERVVVYYMRRKLDAAALTPSSGTIEIVRTSSTYSVIFEVSVKVFLRLIPFDSSQSS